MLSQVQEAAIHRLIIDHRPEQLKMDFHLWRGAAVSQLIDQEFGIKRAYEQSPAAVQAWLEGEYPAIEQRARSEGAEID